MILCLRFSPCLPHKIVEVSKSLCCFLDLEEKNLISRSLGSLFGPETSTLALYQAIKQLERSAVSDDSKLFFGLKIYARNGFAHPMDCQLLKIESSDGVVYCLELDSKFHNSRTTIFKPLIPRAADEKEQIRNENSIHESTADEIRGWHSALNQAIRTLDAFCIADRGNRPSDSGYHPHSDLQYTTSPCCTGVLIITTKAPHTILTASEISAILGFSATDTAERSIRLLYGPLTDPNAIPSAIKRMLLDSDKHHAVSIPDLTLYDRTGAAHTFSASCCRLPAPGGECADARGACRLQLERSSARAGPDSPTPARRPSLPACLWSLPAPAAGPPARICEINSN